MQQPHEMEIRVRYCETDAMGFLHHSHYLNYFEMGRTEAFRAAGGDYRAMEQSGLYFAVVRIECRYRSPARYDDLLTLRTTLARATPARLEHRYELVRGGQLLAEATSVLACVNCDGQAQRMPPDIA